MTKITALRLAVLVTGSLTLGQLASLIADQALGFVVALVIGFVWSFACIWWVWPRI